MANEHVGPAQIPWSGVSNARRQQASNLSDRSTRLSPISRGHGQPLFLHSIFRARDWSESHTLPHRDQSPA
jgi:hypothetical protein